MKRLVDRAEALRTVTELLSITGESGHESAVAQFVRDELARLGLSPKRITTDRANEQIPFETETGNLIAELPGRGSLSSSGPRLFCAHMDTVSLAVGARAVRRGRSIVARDETALGADDRAGVAVLLAAARSLLRGRPDHAPVVLLFTVCEEAGLWGARFAPAALVRRCAMGFSYDGGDPAELDVAAPSSDKYSIEIEGLASHAGAHPERGVSAALVFAEAVSRLRRGGWLGKIVKGRESGTANIGTVSGGLATNIVMPSLRAGGEARSYSERFLDRIGAEFERQFVRAAASVRNASGRHARVRFRRERIYSAFELGPDSPPVRAAVRAAKSLGLRPRLVRQFGGLDANWLNAKGLPTVTLGSGAHSPHQVGERLDIGEYLLACEMAVRLATDDRADA